MRVLHVEKKLKLSGQALHVSRALRGLKARGHEVGLACPPGSALGDEVESEGIPVRRLPMAGIKTYTSAPKLRRFVREFGCQVVHPHGARGHLMSALALLGVRGVALVRTKHNMTGLRSGVFSRILYNRLTARIITVSNAAREVLAADGVPRSRMDLCFNGIDTSRFSPRPKDSRTLDQLGLGRETFVIGLVARLGSKSVDAATLLHAFERLAARHPHARLLLVGRGAEGLARLAEQLGIADRVVLPGFVRDVRAMLSVMDLYVQSNVMAALGTAIIEAMAMARPVVATRIGGHPEVVVDGQTGRLCPAGDPAAMAEVISSMIEAPPQQLAAMGRKGRERAEELFDQERMVERIEEVYERATS